MSRKLGRGEHRFAFLDDTYGFLESALWRLAGIQIHVGKTQICIRPDICDALERSAQAENPSARVWRGSMVPTDRQGIKLPGTPLGHPDYVARHLQPVVQEHRVLLHRIPRVKDLQSAWHQLGPTTCFVQGIPTGLVNSHEPTTKASGSIASLPLVLGGLCLWSAERVRSSADIGQS